MVSEIIVFWDILNPCLWNAPDVINDLKRRITAAYFVYSFPTYFFANSDLFLVWRWRKLNDETFVTTKKT